MLWSVTIPTYNAAEFIAETISSVLIQDRGADEMELLVVDNCSTDNTLEIVRQVGQGRVKVVVNEKNLGPHGNFNRCVEVASGKLVHMLHADDIVKPGFYAKYEQVFAAHPDVHLVSCNAEIIDEHSNVTGQTFTLKSLVQPTSDVSELMKANYLLAPTVVVRKTAYEKLGTFDDRLYFVGDWDMWLRVIFFLKGMYLPEVLAKYRVHSTNGTVGLMKSGQGVLDHDILFNKLFDLGFPISRSQVVKHLKNISSSYYCVYAYSDNTIGSTNMLGMFKKYASPVETLLLTSQIGIRKKLSSIKRMLLRRS